MPDFRHLRPKRRVCRTDVRIRMILKWILKYYVCMRVWIWFKWLYSQYLATGAHPDMI